MKKLNALTIILFTALSLFAGDTETGKLILLKDGVIQFEGATKNTFETTLTVIDPTADRTITLQNADGTLAFLTDTSAAFGPTGTLHVDAANTGDPSEDGSLEHPFDLGSEAFAASSVNNLIIFAPGAYAEAFVIPHDLFVQGAAATGMLSVDISSGDLLGFLGKLLYDAGGVTIYPTSNAIINGDCFDFAWNVGLTTPNAFEITLRSSPSSYDVGSRIYTVGATVNASNISVSGIGANKPHLITSFGVLFSDTIDNHFTNLEITSGSLIINNDAGFASTTNLIHLTINGNITISDLTSTHSGFVQEVSMTAKYKALGPTNSGDIDGLITDKDTTLNNYTGSARIQKAQGLEATGVMSGSISYDSGNLILDGDVTGTIKGIGAGGRLICLNKSITLSLLDSIFTIDVGVNTFDRAIFKAASELSNCKSNIFFQANSIIETGVLYEHCTHEAVNAQSAAVENKGNFVFNHFIHGGASDTRAGFAVSSGAHLHNCLFEGFDALFAIRGRELLADSVNFQGYGSASLFAKYIASSNIVVFPLTSEPQKSSGPGTGTITGMDSDIFDARVIQINDQTSPGAEALSNLEGSVFEFIVFEDVDTTPADGTTDTFGYSTTVGVSIFVIHSTATDATAIDDLLANPAGDIISATAISFMAQAATIKATAVNLGAGLIAPEIDVDFNNVDVSTVKFHDSGSLFGVTVEAAGLTVDRTITLTDEGFPLLDQNYIIITPTEWMINDDVDDKNASLNMGANVGVHVGDTSNELFVGVPIPQGKKATLVDVTASASRVINVFSVTSAGVKTSLGTGNANTQLDITDTNGSQSTYLLIEYVATSLSDDIRFTLITLEDII